MIPYFVVLFVSGASAALAFRTPDKRNSTLFSLVAILAPCLLAAFRDPTVGVDVLTYAEPSFYSAISRNIWEYIASSDNEPLFSLLAYVSANVFQSSFVYYFLIELLVVAPVYKAIKDNCPRSLRFLAWLVFYFTLFGFSFNLMRQSIAVAILLAGFSYLSKKSYFKYCLVVIVACGFHYSSLMGFVVLALYVLFDSKKLSLLKKNRLCYGFHTHVGLCSRFDKLRATIQKLIFVSIASHGRGGAMGCVSGYNRTIDHLFPALLHGVFKL